MTQDTPTELVLTEIQPAGYAVLTLNRPQAMNALNKALMQALADTIDALAANPVPAVKASVTASAAAS